MRSAVLVLLFLLLPGSASAQDSTAADQKDPALAAAYGTAILGGGHFYAGEPVRAVGLWVAGPGSFALGRYLWLDSERKNSFPLYAGAGMLLASWMYSVFDAPHAARRANQSQNVSLQVSPSRSGVKVAVRVRF